MATILVDTSAWIEFFRADGDARYRTRIEQLLDDNDAALCGIILAELLKGARSDREYRELDDRLATLTYFDLPESLWRTVGRHASHLLRKGVQVPIADLIIATLAIEHRASLLHNDRHFPLLAKHLPLHMMTI